MKVAIVGLGKMGANMAEPLRRADHDVVGYDRDPDASDVASLDEAVTALDGEPRRVMWVMVPAGDPTDGTVRALAGLLSDGDLVVDGGNSNFHDSQRHAEGYELLSTADLDIDVQASLEVWWHGSVVRSWLLDLLADGLARDPGLASVSGYAEDSGEGRWTVEEAIANAVPVPAISAALFARFASRQDDSPAMKAIATLRNQFGGHAVRSA